MGEVMNIIELAKRVGFQDADWNYNKGLEKALKQFANLVAAQEREECAKVCIQMANRCDDIRKAALEAAAEAIRARGTT